MITAGKIDKAEYKTRRKGLLDDKQAVTSRISETCRYISFGLLAIFYTLHTTKDDYGRQILAKGPVLLTTMALLAALSILCDYLQYFSGRQATERALMSDDQRYDTSWASYRLRGFFFIAKQILMLGGAAILLVVIAAFLTSPASPK